MNMIFGWLHGFWSDIVIRTEGPLKFRFVMQPAVAAILAAIDGIKDAKSGRPPYLWEIVYTKDNTARLRYWREGIIAVSRVMLLAVVMDAIYQFKVFGTFTRLLQAFVVAVVLGFIPYLLLRGPFGRFAKWWLGRHKERA